MIIGTIYYNDKLFDSAYLYFDKVYKNTESIGSKKQAAEWLAEICKIQGRQTEVLEYADFLIPYANQDENRSFQKSQLVALLQKHEQEKADFLHQQQILRNHKTANRVIGLLLSLSTFAFILYYVSKKRHQHLKTTKEQIKKQLEAERYAHQVQQKALVGRLKKSHEAMRSIVNNAAAQDSAQEKVQNSNPDCPVAIGYEAFMQSEGCKEVLETVEKLHKRKQEVLKTNVDITDYKDFALSNLQLAALTSTANTCLPNFFASLKTLYPALNEKDKSYCCLYLMGLDKMSICVLLQEKYHTCRRNTMKLESRFGCGQGLTVFLTREASRA